MTHRIEAEGQNLLLRARPDDRLSLQPAYRDGFRVFAGRARDVRFTREFLPQ